MKKINRIAVVAMVIASTLFVGCSNEDAAKSTPVNSTSTTNIVNAAKTVSSTESDFLADTYKTTYTYGDYIETKDENGTELVVTEVIVGTDTIARGYVVNRKSDGEFLYFADVDRTTNTMKATNMITKELDVATDMDQNQYYNEVGGDMIKLIDHVNNADVQTDSWFVGGGGTFSLDHFWGTNVEHTSGPIYDSNLDCHRDQLTVKRIFWIKVSSHTAPIEC